MKPIRYLVGCFQSPKTRNYWRSILFTPLGVIGSDYLAVAPIGTDVFLWWSLLFYGFAALAAFLALWILPFVAIGKRYRDTAFAWWIASFCFFLLFSASAKSGRAIRMNAFEKLAARSEVVVDAIKAFERETGNSPTALVELVPDFLPKVPTTGMMAYPEYEYYLTPSRSDGNPWILSISTPSGGINFDRFVYYPLENYPRYGESGWFERVGNWAYYHE